MWRLFLICLMTVACCSAIPKADSKRELQRLVRLPRVIYAQPLQFDRTTGFNVFPVTSQAAAEVAELLEDAEGNPADAPLYLSAARVYASAGDVSNSLRSYARGADLFKRKLQAGPENLDGLLGLAECLSALGRFAEAQASLQQAAATAEGEPALHLAYARFHQEKAWTAFAGDENRFRDADFVFVLGRLVLQRAGTRIEASERELALASSHLGRIAHPRQGPEFLRARAAFYSFRAALDTAFRQIRRQEVDPRALRQSLATPEAIEALQEAAKHSMASPAVIATAIFATALEDIEDDSGWGVWPHLGSAVRREVSDLVRRLEAADGSGAREAAERSEFLGCVQFYLMKDLPGAERSFRRALTLEPSSERSWDLLVYALSLGDPARMVEACEQRYAALPNPRSSVLLVKSYDRRGDALRAQIAALSAAIAYPDDFSVNLTLAALLLKRDDVHQVLWRVANALDKAEKQMGSAPGREARLELALLKSIFLGISGETEKAKAVLAPHVSPGRTAPEVHDVLRALES